MNKIDFVPFHAYVHALSSLAGAIFNVFFSTAQSETTSFRLFSYQKRQTLFAS